MCACAAAAPEWTIENLPNVGIRPDRYHRPVPLPGTNYLPCTRAIICLYRTSAIAAYSPYPSNRYHSCPFRQTFPPGAGEKNARHRSPFPGFRR